MEKIVLSFCIPTHNRYKYLKKCLNSIVKQKPYTDGIVEIVVSDNASSDNTEKFMKKYAKLHKNIKYYRHNKIIIPESNFRFAVRKASGLYIKMCNDAAIVNDNCIDDIVKLIYKNKNTKPYIFFSNQSGSTKMYNFNSFAKEFSFASTNLLTLGMWNVDKKKVVDDSTADKLWLWCCYANLKLAYNHKYCLIYNYKIFTIQELTQKILSYDLYKIFHNNFFEIISTYIKNKSLTNEDVNMIEKKIFINYFTLWLAYYKSKDKRLSFQNNENFYDKVINICKQKPYYYYFLIVYYLKYYYLKIKNYVFA